MASSSNHEVPNSDVQPPTPPKPNDHTRDNLNNSTGSTPPAYDWSIRAVNRPDAYWASGEVGHWQFECPRSRPRSPVQIAPTPQTGTRQKEEDEAKGKGTKGNDGTQGGQRQYKGWLQFYHEKGGNGGRGGHSGLKNGY